MGLARTGQRMTEQMQQGVYTAAAPEGGVQGGAQAVQFGRKFNARSKYDDEMNIRMQLADKEGNTPFGKMMYDDKVGKWIQEKEAAVEAANFDSYFNQNFNKNDLASRQWAQQINPEFYSAREQEMNDRAEMVLKLKKIELRGPQNEEDLKILYLIENGRVVLPENWDTIAPGFIGTTITREQEKENQRLLSDGLIRKPLFLTAGQQRSQATQNKRAGAWGNPNTQNYFDGAEPPIVKTGNNKPLSSRAGGRTMGFNFANFLAGKQ
jgi:hypothetical protein